MHGTLGGSSYWFLELKVCFPLGVCRWKMISVGMSVLSADRDNLGCCCPVSVALLVGQAAVINLIYKATATISMTQFMTVMTSSTSSTTSGSVQERTLRGGSIARSPGASDQVPQVPEVRGEEARCCSGLAYLRVTQSSPP